MASVRHQRRQFVRAASMCAAAGVLTLGSLALTSGCAVKGADGSIANETPTVPAEGTDPARPAPARDGRAWWPTPVEMQVFPNTRYVVEDGQPFLEVRIELIDTMGDPVKAPGSVQLELLNDLGQAMGRPGSRLYAWDVEITDLDGQRQYFDPIIYGYVFRLRLDDIGPANRRTFLRVNWLLPGGERLVADRRLTPEH